MNCPRCGKKCVQIGHTKAGKLFFQCPAGHAFEATPIKNPPEIGAGKVSNTFFCPYCQKRFPPNFMVVTQHLNTHNIDYSTVRQLWDIFRKVKNPPELCEYCRLLGHHLAYARTPKARRHILARAKLHKKVLHSNPPDKARIRLARASYKVAFLLYRHFKHTGVPQSIMDRVPAKIRPYVEATLDASGVKVVRN